jgi:hypothetical protein
MYIKHRISHVLFYIWHHSPYLIDSFNATVLYGTGFPLFTFSIWHLAMRFVLAAGPSRTLRYRTVRYREIERARALEIESNGAIAERTCGRCGRTPRLGSPVKLLPRIRRTSFEIDKEHWHWRVAYALSSRAATKITEYPLGSRLLLDHRNRRWSACDLASSSRLNSWQHFSREI